jgi:phospholipid/cholesterol/gamma-HCH transport system ATP-binding protein
VPIPPVERTLNGQLNAFCRRVSSPLEISPLDQPAEASAGSSSKGIAVLRFDQVSVRFDDKPVLVNISFEICAGETIVLYGAAGSGKTVLLKTVIGLIRHDAGRVYLFGRDITGLREEELYSLRHRVGVLFQEGALFDFLTVEENVAYPLLNRGDREPPESEVEARVKEALDFVDLGGALGKYPSELSGGMRRRVAIARAAVTNPPLMLYDSPTAGLDPVTAYRIMTLPIRQRDTRNATLLVVTHRHQDGKLLANYRYDPKAGKLMPGGDKHHRTRFFVLREGRIVFQGSEAEMRSSDDPYVAIFAGEQRPVPVHLTKVTADGHGHP